MIFMYSGYLLIYAGNSLICIFRICSSLLYVFAPVKIGKPSEPGKPHPVRDNSTHFFYPSTFVVAVDLLRQTNFAPANTYE